MTTIVVDDLHLALDPQAHLETQVSIARHHSSAEDPATLLVRCPDRATNAVTPLRPNDIAELLLPHGQVSDLTVTPAGTILAGCKLAPRRGKLAVWTGYAIGPWMPSDITQRGLGGSETAAVRLAENLSEMGWAVTLYGQFESAGLVGGVLLKDFRTMDWSEHHDALIIFRQAWMLDSRPNADFVALWLEDLPGLEGITQQRMRNLDRVCAVSRWHKAATEEHYPFLRDMKSPGGHDLVAACRNGIQTEWFAEDPELERERRVLYTSSPDRGGDVLLELWPRIRERVPDAELILTYSRWYDLCAEATGGQRLGHRRLLELVEQPGVRRIEHGLGQKDLANLMRSSLVWCHPSWYTDGDIQFHETSCISAMEAQAAGCVVVCSDWGALSETVAHGTKIDGDPREVDGPWRERFVDAVVAGLTDPDVQHQAQRIGPEMVRHMDWRGAAEQLAAMIPRKPVYSEVVRYQENIAS